MLHTLWSNQARVPQLLSLCSRARELQPLTSRAATTEACAPWSPRSAVREAAAMESQAALPESSSRLLHPEKAHSNEYPVQPKIKQIKTDILQMCEAVK